MFSMFGRVRDYNPVTDTASVELEGLGVIDAWLDGIRIHAALNRSLIYHGALITLAAPDLHRLCEAVITAAGDSPGTPASTSGSGAVKTQFGRGFVATNSGGTGSATVTFSPPFAAPPGLLVTADDRSPVTVTGLTASGATVSITDAGKGSSYVYFSWQAQGN